MPDVTPPRDPFADAHPDRAQASSLGNGPPPADPALEPAAPMPAAARREYGGGYGGLPRVPGTSGWHRDEAGDALAAPDGDAPTGEAPAPATGPTDAT